MRERIEQHLQERIRQGQGPVTLVACRHCLQDFEGYCAAGDLALKDLTGSHLAQYREHLRWTPRSGRLPAAATVYQHLRFVRAFLRWNCPEFADQMVLPRPQSRIRRLLSRRELEEALDRPDPKQNLGLRDRALLRVVAELGLKTPACRALNDTQLCRQTGRLANLPLSPILLEVLLRYLERGRPALLRNSEQSALFLNCHGGRMSAPNVLRLVRLYSQSSPSDLHRSWLAHREAEIGRRLRGV